MRMLDDFRKDNNGSDEAVSLTFALFSSISLQWLQDCVKVMLKHMMLISCSILRKYLHLELDKK